MLPYSLADFPVQSEVHPIKNDYGLIVAYQGIVTYGTDVWRKVVNVNRTGADAKDREKARHAATVWTRRQRAVVVGNILDMKRARERAAEIATQLAAESEARFQASISRIDRLTEGVRNAAAMYGKGRAGYYLGYVNVYGNLTDGDA